MESINIPEKVVVYMRLLAKEMCDGEDDEEEKRSDLFVYGMNQEEQNWANAIVEAVFGDRL